MVGHQFHTSRLLRLVDGDHNANLGTIAVWLFDDNAIVFLNCALPVVSIRYRGHLACSQSYFLPPISHWALPWLRRRLALTLHS